MDVKVITVDGETFEVRERGRECDFLWVGGRHQGDYGFGSTRNEDGPRSMADHRKSIRAFLDGVDPVTGYLE
ncbi:hypothetical protein [Ruania zhangjianzhongii]|uniref:hypothetical protein n=1 Tax=Ruania zhangjianzhongii TaxID=2603206 RepID=UPI0011CB96FD|nr:hypothetical protein [Ruania zhangjianzhongii]